MYIGRGLCKGENERCRYRDPCPYHEANGRLRNAEDSEAILVTHDYLSRLLNKETKYDDARKEKYDELVLRLENVVMAIAEHGVEVACYNLEAVDRAVAHMPKDAVLILDGTDTSLLDIINETLGRTHNGEGPIVAHFETRCLSGHVSKTSQLAEPCEKEGCEALTTKFVFSHFYSCI